MERPEIPIRLADLRRLAREVPAYIARQVFEERVPLTARLEDDLGISGDDFVELLEDFIEAYRVDAAGFDFTKFISPEGLDSAGCLLAVPLALYWLMTWLLKATVAGLCWPAASGLARRIWQWPVPMPATVLPVRLPLTVGDFVASAATGRFVLRGQVRFRLVGT